MTNVNRHTAYLEITIYFYNPTSSSFFSTTGSVNGAVTIAKEYILSSQKATATLA